MNSSRANLFFRLQHLNEKILTAISISTQSNEWSQLFDEKAQLIENLIRLEDRESELSIQELKECRQMSEVVLQLEDQIQSQLEASLRKSFTEKGRQSAFPICVSRQQILPFL